MAAARDPMARRAKMLYEYIATRPGEISVAAHSIVTVRSAPNAQNWTLIEDSEGTRGYVPADWLGDPDPVNKGPRPVSFSTQMRSEVYCAMHALLHSDA